MSCAPNETATAKPNTTSEIIFTEVTDVIPFENRNRRKFDNAVIGDFDQDGRQDIILNEHGREMRIFWNEGARFKRGPMIASGDVHGAAVADYDGDGKIDIIITQGGGDGANPRRPLRVKVDKSRKVSKGLAFDYFEPGRGRAAKFLNSPTDDALNLLVTGFATPSQTKGANHYYDNIGGGDFKFSDHLPDAARLGFRATITDFNNDNIDDVLLFGADTVLAAQGRADGSFFDATETVFGELASMKDISTITEIDFDNDGDYDLFFTRSEFQFDLEAYYDAAEQRFAFLSFRKDFLFDDMKVDGPLIIENLQRTYPHYDMFLGSNKTPYSFTGNPHGHQNLVIKPNAAMGWPEGETKGGLYIGYMGDGNWRIGGQIQSRIAATFRNVITPAKTTPQPDMPARLFENKGGTFIDATERLGIDIADQTTSATAADFNNDGWMDLALLRYGSMALRNEHVVYLNQNGKSFGKANQHGLKATEIGSTGGSIEAFDYDLDGNVDVIYSNERGKWHLMKNTHQAAGKTNYVIVKVGTSPEGASPLGAKLTVRACGGIYHRKVGATSAGYSQSYNTDLHIGVGACEKIDSVTLLWANGDTKRLKTVNVNGILNLP